MTKLIILIISKKHCSFDYAPETFKREMCLLKYVSGTRYTSREYVPCDNHQKECWIVTIIVGLLGSYLPPNI